MRKSVKAMLVMVCCALPVAGGCAKHELVKKDETVPQAAAAPAKDVTVKKEKAEPVKEAPVKESAVQQDALKPMPQAGELKTTTLKNIYFDFDSFKLSEQSRATLAGNAQLLKQEARARIKIEGNCDERGADEYNLALGERRAKAAMQYLVTMGIPADRLSVISYGKEKPADPGHDEAAWSKNRRDEFVVVK